jgi:hypothetical protein
MLLLFDTYIIFNISLLACKLLFMLIAFICLTYITFNLYLTFSM